MRKRILAGLVCLFLLLTVVGSIPVSSEAGERFSGGSGSEDDPYLLASLSDLHTLAEATKTETFRKKYFRLTADVNEGFDGGIGKDRDHPFSGKFDGNGHTVRLEISSGGQYAGMFGYLVGSEVRSLCVDGFVTGSDCVGGICGCAENSDFLGCVNKCTLRATGDVGGIFGWAMDFIIANCANYGDVTAEKNHAGGIFGEGSMGKVMNCYSQAVITGRSYVGGIGFAFGNAFAASDCYYLQYEGFDRGAISGREDKEDVRGLSAEECAGGLLAAVLNAGRGDVAGVWTKNADGTPLLIPGEVSGGVGSAEMPCEIGDIEAWNAFAAKVNGGKTFAGLHFALTADLGEEENYASETAQVRTVCGLGTPFAGHFDGQGHTVYVKIAGESGDVGLFGVLENASVRDLRIAGSVDAAGSRVGAVCGRAENSIFEKCVLLAAVKGSSAVGGLCGSMEGGSVLKCESRSAVTAESSEAGGICGEVQGVSLKSCASFGKVTASENAGGICGLLSGGAEIRNCVSHAVLRSGDGFGGIVGKAEGSKVQNCFAKVGNTNAVGGVCSGTVFADCYYEEAGEAAFGSLGGDCKTQTVEGIDAADYSIRKPEDLLNDGKESGDASWIGDRDGSPVLMLARNEYAVSLCGDFDLVFYLDLAWYEEDLGLSPEQIVVEAGFVQNEETYNPNLTEMTYTAETMTVGNDGKYRAVFPVTADRMAMPVEVFVTVGQGKEQKRFRASSGISVKGYCDKMIDDKASPEALKTLCKTVLNYGAAVMGYSGAEPETFPNRAPNGQPRRYEVSFAGKTFDGIPVSPVLTEENYSLGNLTFLPTLQTALRFYYNTRDYGHAVTAVLPETTGSAPMKERKDFIYAIVGGVPSPDYRFEYEELYGVVPSALAKPFSLTVVNQFGEATFENYTVLQGVYDLVAAGRADMEVLYEPLLQLYEAAMDYRG